jgi:tetratricopeptide (TPR) repeat protein
MNGSLLLDATELSRVIPPMIVQFFLMTSYWFGSAGRLPAPWTRILLPLLMIGTGLLFFSEPLEPAWRPFVGGLPPAVPASVALLVVLALNLGAAGVAVAATGGLVGSPFVALLFGVPGLAWILGSGGTTVSIVGALALVTAGLVPWRWSVTPTGSHSGMARLRVLLPLLAAVGVAAVLARGGAPGPGDRGPLRAERSALPACDALDGAVEIEACLERLLARGRDLQRSGRLTSADSAYGRAAAQAEALGLRDQAFAAHLGRGLTGIRLVGLEPALAHVERARALIEPSDRIRLAESECVEGGLRAVAQDPMAVEHSRRGLRILGATVHAAEGVPVDHDDAEALTVVGRCLFGLGQHFARNVRAEGDSALLYLVRASEVQLATGDAYGRAASLQWLASVLHGQARYLEALDWYDQASDEATRAGNLSAAAWASQGRAGLLADLGDLPAARAEMVRSGDRMEASGDRFGMGFARRLGAGLALADRRPDEAEHLLDQAVAILTELGDEDAARDALTVRVAIARVRGDPDGIVAAVDALLDATDGGRLIEGSSIPRLAATGALLQIGDLDRVAAILEETEGAGSRSWIARWTWAVRWAELEARRGNLPEAERWMREGLEWMDRLRAFVYDGDLRQAALNLRGTDQVDPDLGVATVIAGLADGGRVAAAFELAAELRARDLEGERLQSLMLAADEVVEDAVVDVRSGTSVAAVADALGDDEALLLYVTGRGAEATTLFVVARGGVRSHVLASIDDLEPSVRRMRALVESGDDAFELRRRLGSELLGPALEGLPAGIRSLLIVPDHGLHAVPFDALVVGEREPEALVEGFTVTYVPSPGLLAALRGAPSLRRDGGILAVSWGAAAVLDDGSRLPRLRRVDAEARGVTRGFPGSTRLSGRNATVARVLEAAERGYPVLHVAAHARVDPHSPGRSALFLAPDGAASGALRLVEIETRRLPFQLVVLSACTTAGGREDRGEGLRGPARAFLSAGSRSVVATGWSISDRAAARQMEALYRELAQNVPVGEALARVKRGEIRAGRPPRDWAAFQLLGAPDTRVGPG